MQVQVHVRVSAVSTVLGETGPAIRSVKARARHDPWLLRLPFLIVVRRWRVILASACAPCVDDRPTEDEAVTVSRTNNEYSVRKYVYHRRERERERERERVGT